MPKGPKGEQRPAAVMVGAMISPLHSAACVASSSLSNSRVISCAGRRPS